MDFLLLFCCVTLMDISLRAAGMEIVRDGQNRLMDEDFEGTFPTEFWHDESNGETRWALESSLAAIPFNRASANHLRVYRSPSTFDVAVLKSATFTAHPGDGISFDYRIHSQYPQMANLQLCWSITGKEKILLELFQQSNPNDDPTWQTAVASIPIHQPSNVTFIFYGYCPFESDSLAIDNIVVFSSVATASEHHDISSGSPTSAESPSSITSDATYPPTARSMTSTITTETTEVTTSLRTSAITERATTTQPPELCHPEEDYYPCYEMRCNIVCSGFPFSDVTQVFDRLSSAGIVDIKAFFLDLPRNNMDPIPANVLADVRVHYEIRLTCSSTTDSITIHPDAFNASREFTTLILIQYCDLNQLNFDFLADFKRLSNLTISDSINIHQSGLPDLPAASLPSLSLMIVDHTPDIGRIKGFPDLKLNAFILSYNDLDDDSMDSLMSQVVSTAVSETLTELTLDQNRLTSIPKQIVLFKHLKSVKFDYNNIPIIKTDSFNFTVNDASLALQFCQVEAIEPGAFKGNFSGTSDTPARISLASNKMTRIEASVFQELLEQMLSASYGSEVNLFDNPIDCEEDLCHLAWLVRDHRQLLLRAISWGVSCSNGTRLVDLNYETGFNECPPIQLPSTYKLLTKTTLNQN